jgi:hypothetical protein
VRAMEAWLQFSGTAFGPVFRKVSMWQTVEHRALSPDAVRQILQRRAELAGLVVSGRERLSPTGCGPASSPKPTGPAPVTRRSWNTPGTAT